MSHAVIHLKEPLSPPRIGGIAAALAVHVAALMMLMAPMSYAPSLPETEEVTIVPEMLPEKIIEKTKPHIERKLEIKPLEVPIVQKQTIAPPVIPPIVIDQGSENDVPYVVPDGEIVGPAFDPPSGPISLSTEYAPAPKYPPLSLRNGEEGIVLLLVKVGADGKPIDASIKKSSGYRELDRNALKHVLATWRFHPAMHQGIAIPALALVPVNYTIDQ
ncbi:MAG: energy transducer TonB [Arenimonas sp.]